MAAGLNRAVALVTGASSGIGEATARELAVREAAVALAARLTAAGGTARIVQTDLTERDESRKAVNQTVRAWGRPPPGAGRR
jgi:NADP-dependent 3-hydroxy acid dehydrogenase YdfG